MNEFCAGSVEANGSPDPMRSLDYECCLADRRAELTAEVASQLFRAKSRKTAVEECAAEQSASMGVRPWAQSHTPTIFGTMHQRSALALERAPFLKAD